MVMMVFDTHSAQVHFSDHVITPVAFTEDLLTNDLKRRCKL